MKFLISKKGFTFIEILIVIGILIVLTGITVPFLRDFKQEFDLNNSIEEIISALRFAQNKTISSEESAQYGVYFETGKYVLFKGQNYDPLLADNEIRNLPQNVEIYEISLGGVNEVVFNRLTGTANQSGNISLRLKTDLTKVKTIYIENSGQVGLIAPLDFSDENRVKDSRHVHFEYNRFIDTGSEKLILNFDSAVVQEIIIVNYIQDGQIFWKGEIEVEGQTQKILIQTHRLNDPSAFTQFSVLRDRRYNNKPLKITISGDGSGTLVEYSVDGLSVSNTSIYAASLQWQ